MDLSKLKEVIQSYHPTTINCSLAIPISWLCQMVLYMVIWCFVCLMKDYPLTNFRRESWSSHSDNEIKPTVKYDIFLQMSKYKDLVYTENAVVVWQGPWTASHSFLCSCPGVRHLWGASCGKLELKQSRLGPQQEPGGSAIWACGIFTKVWYVC